MKPDSFPLQPGFFVLGAQKAGTTALHDWLAAQPGLCLPKGKETHFFSHPKRFAQGAGWYARQYPAPAGGAICGEVDPDYLFLPETPGRMLQLGLSPRFLVIVRDPLARAYSHYRMSVRRGVEPLAFPEALRAEPKRLAASPDMALPHFSYMARGRYTEQVERYATAFPASPLLVVSYEELFSPATNAEAFGRICRFLDLDSFTLPEVGKRRNQATMARVGLLNAILWDRERFGTLRSMVRLALPLRALRDAVAHRMDALNQRPAAPAQDWLCGVDPGFLVQAAAEAERVATRFALDTKSWQRQPDAARA